jgi:uncharacterized DUF497 family protein
MARFEWDPAKAEANRIKHGVGFEEARTVFTDETGIDRHDPDRSQREHRFLVLGWSAEGRLLVVAYAWAGLGRAIRIISARPATSRERALYARRGRP